MMNNNNQMTYNNQTMFSQYEVQHATNTFQQSGLNALPQMPGFTPVIMNCPIFPQENAFAPMPMPFNPLFFSNNANAGVHLNQPPTNNVPNLSPVFLPMPSPNFVPNLSNSPPQMLPLLSLSPIPPPLVSISSPPQMSQSAPPSQQSSASNSLPSYLNAALHVPDYARDRSRSASVASESDSGCDVEVRNRSVSREMGPAEAPSKRALVDSTLGWMQSVFGERYDNDGTRGENVLRLKVKTVIALEHIVEFIQRCNAEGLIHSISCPVSTKKGRQHVRGYLAYIKGFTGASADRIERIFEEFNREKGFPFKTLHRNPASTL